MARPAAVGCRAHTGWAALVVLAGPVERPAVIARERAALDDPRGAVRRDVYHAARELDLAAAAALVRAAERFAGERADAALERAVEAAAVRACGVLVGTAPVPEELEAILASHPLVHAAEGRLYRDALLQAAEARGLATVAVPERSAWDVGAAALGEGLPERVDDLGRGLGPPWAQDQKLAALAAWIALAEAA